MWCRCREHLKISYLVVIFIVQDRNSYRSFSYEVETSDSNVFSKLLFLLMEADGFKHCNLIQYGTINLYHIVIQISLMSTL